MTENDRGSVRAVCVFIVLIFAMSVFSSIMFVYVS